MGDDHREHISIAAADDGNAVFDVFRALADPTRRAVLDALFDQDGQTLTALSQRFAMSRIGVMKHLDVLEGAGLVTTRRQGREKLHHLNVVPLQALHERWVSKYTARWATGLLALRRELEGTAMDQTNDLDEPRTLVKVFEIYIRTTPEALWSAITDPATRSKYQFGAVQHSTWTEGSSYRMTAGAEGPMLGEGENLVVEPPKRLVQTMVALWGDDVRAEGTTRVTWEIEPVADSCRLVVTHDQMREGTNDQIFGGWPMILSGLKTWLETGTVLTTPGSLLYATE